MLVNIDAGHGSQTAGKRTPDGYREHWINVKTASYFEKELQRCGFTTMKTGWNDDNATDDVDTSLSDRQKQIKAAGADYSVSWHANACGDGKSYNSGQGIETLISDKDDGIGDSYNMAVKIQNELIKHTLQKNRGVKRQALSMCNCKYMGTIAAVLIEIGFMTNEHEAELMKTDAFCKECAQEAAQGFCNYIGVPYIPETTKVDATSTTDTSYKVKVKVDSLNIRKSNSILSKVVGTITNKGIYTIVETKGSWGKLKSGAGWISVNSKYVTRV